MSSKRCRAIVASLLLLPFLAGGAARAQLLITATDSSITTKQSDTVNFGTNSPGSGGLVSTGPIGFNLGSGVSGTITFTGNSGVYNGSSGPWAPDVQGGRMTSNFLVASPGGIATMTFSTPVAKLGFLWGSVGPVGDGNLLTFYNGNTVIGTAKGSDVLAAAGVSNNQSTIATMFSFPTASLTKVVVSTNNTFEFTLLQTTQPAPAPLDPVGATLLGNLVALGAVGVYRRRRKSAASAASPALAH